MSVLFTIRNAEPNEFQNIGALMVDVYSSLEGFLTIEEHPSYYRTLANIGDILNKPGTEILVAVDNSNKLLGAVVYFGDMQYYGAEGAASSQKNAAGFRFLAVSNEARGLGVGKLLTIACIDKARSQELSQVVIHSTEPMKTARSMYEKIGFERSTDLDFQQGELPVYGFRFEVKSKSKR